MRLTSVPLQLDSFVYSHINVEPNLEAPGTPGELSSKSLGVDDLEVYLSSLTEPDENSALIVSLTVRTTDDSQNIKGLGLKFAIGVIGSFTLRMGLLDSYRESEDVQSIVVGNCGMILYGVIRDLLHTLTGKMPLGSLVLPSGGFDGIRKVKPEEEVGSSARPSAGVSPKIGVKKKGEAP